MARDDSIYIQHILDSISRIQMYCLEIDLEKFLQNPMLQDAVIRQLEIMGEATKHLCGINKL